ncbi:TIGR03905 family TSCPD domain-containing protein [Paludicola sp. MB14-C6]|uniref:TIGR03905 family TSCPD domain-containing protein n=1 Tax=Paludihabitans sp. MB14-C6 TaxID=3070656 RepID=UPI0027DD7509|nr:TIGR03905 family TSCPD domain-containing protein [Paludicola sp. MB14-C6]WMJ23395.1 TIGR03905 family TSCPD domain-containing protein [Paludicola sp. MB14-C6]
MTHLYKTKGTCSRNIKVTIEDGIITDVAFDGGCNGNLKGISKLTIGRKATDVIATLKGIDCNGRGTSCPDQLSKAIEEALSK